MPKGLSRFEWSIRGIIRMNRRTVHVLSMRKNEQTMTTKDPPGAVTPTPALPAKRNAPKRRREVNRALLTSRYFSKADKCSFRFRTSRGIVRTTKKKESKNRGHITDVLIPNAIEEKEDGTISCSMFPDRLKISSMPTAQVSSDYFLHSPSSAYGSVLSLGPLVYTWISSSDCQEIRSNCERRQSPYENIRDACDPCLQILRAETFQHFEACPIFRKELEACVSNPSVTDGKPFVIRKHQKSTCVERVGQWAEAHLLRHLCPNQCYLRAFAPSREWMLLRTKLEKLSPIGEALNDWTCRLVYEVEENPISDSSTVSSSDTDQDIEATSSNSVKLSPVHLPRTVFVSLKSRKSFPSFEKARESIFDEINPSNIICSGISASKKSGELVIDEDMYAAAVNEIASPFGLLEELFPEQPWRVLICTMLLNKTQRKQNLDGILFHLFQKWPTAYSVVKDADDNEESVRRIVFSLVRPAGLGHAKAKAFVRLSRDYLHLLTDKRKEIAPSLHPETSTKNENSNTLKGVEFELTRKEVKKLFNCGDYAADAYQIFIRKEFRSPLLSNDHMLVAYTEWKRSLFRLLEARKQVLRTF